jgi:hypothetical protein
MALDDTLRSAVETRIETVVASVDGFAITRDRDRGNGEVSKGENMIFNSSLEREAAMKDSHTAV